MERKLLLGLSGVRVPNDCRLEKETWVSSQMDRGEGRAARNAPSTLSTPALRIELPFLFHLSANMGPLCCPKVLARFPGGQEPHPFVLQSNAQHNE